MYGLNPQCNPTGCYGSKDKTRRVMGDNYVYLPLPRIYIVDFTAARGLSWLADNKLPTK